MTYITVYKTLNFLKYILILHVKRKRCWLHFTLRLVARDRSGPRTQNFRILPQYFYPLLCLVSNNTDINCHHNNNEHMLSSCANNSCMSGAFPNAFQSFTHSIFMASLWGRHHYFTHFTGEGTRNQRSPPNWAANKWQNQESHPGVWLHLLVTLLSIFSGEKKKSQKVKAY